MTQVVLLSKENTHRHSLTTGVLSEADGTRTRNHWIDSPVL